MTDDPLDLVEDLLNEDPDADLVDRVLRNLSRDLSREGADVDLVAVHRARRIRNRCRHRGRQ